jgi:hypothetical protein
VVVVHPPGGGPHRVDPSPLYDAIPTGSLLFRIYDPTDHGHPVEFRHWGPTARFDHHIHPYAAPAHDPDHAVYDAAFAFEDCLVEVFGDDRVIDRGERRLAVTYVGRPLRLLDLRGVGAMRVGSVAALTSIVDRSLTQQWARFLYAHPKVLRATDGMIYPNAHNGEDAVVLFERAAGTLTLVEDHRLDDPRLDDALRHAARTHNLVVNA